MFGFGLKTWLPRAWDSLPWVNPNKLIGPEVQINQLGVLKCCLKMKRDLNGWLEDSPYIQPNSYAKGCLSIIFWYAKINCFCNFVSLKLQEISSFTTRLKISLSCYTRGGSGCIQGFLLFANLNKLSWARPDWKLMPLTELLSEIRQTAVLLFTYNVGWSLSTS